MSAGLSQLVAFCQLSAWVSHLRTKGAVEGGKIQESVREEAGCA